MLGTTFVVEFGELGVPFIGTEGTGWERDITRLGALVAVILLGPGRWSVDASLSRSSATAGPSQPRPSEPRPPVGAE